MKRCKDCKNCFNYYCLAVCLCSKVDKKWCWQANPNWNCIHYARKWWKFWRAK